MEATTTENCSNKIQLANDSAG